jgi:exodeoxyribonuclease V beta subunit
MPGYDYAQHIGGSFYLFLRGMSVNTPLSGVFYDKPPQALIESLDALFDQEVSITSPSNPNQSNGA